MWMNIMWMNIMQLLKFIITTTYFSFRGTIYQQKFCTAMRCPVSPVIVNLLMEWLEQQAILTEPITCKPKLWKIYADDVIIIHFKDCPGNGSDDKTETNMER